MQPPLEPLNLQYNCLGDMFICNVPKEWAKSNAEIEDDVKPHFRYDLSWEAAFNLLACSEHHDSHECIECVAETEKLLACIDSYREVSSNTYTGMIPMTLLQPNLIPQQLNKPISSR
jgi:hypothetical protein